MGNLAIFEQRADISGITDELKVKDEEIQKMKAEMNDMKMKLLELLVSKHDEQLNGKHKK